MKNTTKTNFLNLLISVGLLSVFFSSCTKEPNAENIIYNVYNKTFTTVPGVNKFDSVDLNLDSKVDLLLRTRIAPTLDSFVCLLASNNVGFYIDSTYNIGAVPPDPGIPIYMDKPLDKNQTPAAITPGERLWAGLYTFFGYKENTTEYGFAGAGDKYIAIVMIYSLSHTYHYGWVRVNLSADFRTFKVIDGAYNATPNIPIAMGAK
ncbi:MAG: hypothetical protein IPM95_03815 [Sphingobacteriales bacterium]|nr:hypothetical protein [Sphingobacteriales bacterium]